MPYDFVGSFSQGLRDAASIAELRDQMAGRSFQQGLQNRQFAASQENSKQDEAYRQAQLTGQSQDRFARDQETRRRAQEYGTTFAEKTGFEVNELDALKKAMAGDRDRKARLEEAQIASMNSLAGLRSKGLGKTSASDLRARLNMLDAIRANKPELFDQEEYNAVQAELYRLTGVGYKAPGTQAEGKGTSLMEQYGPDIHGAAAEAFGSMDLGSQMSGQSSPAQRGPARVQVNPKTGQRRVSYDGGKTWAGQ